MLFCIRPKNLAINGLAFSVIVFAHPSHALLSREAAAQLQRLSTEISENISVENPDSKVDDQAAAPAARNPASFSPPTAVSAAPPNVNAQTDLKPQKVLPVPDSHERMPSAQDTISGIEIDPGDEGH